MLGPKLANALIILIVGACVALPAAAEEPATTEVGGVEMANTLSVFVPAPTEEQPDKVRPVDLTLNGAGHRDPWGSFYVIGLYLAQPVEDADKLHDDELDKLADKLIEDVQQPSVVYMHITRKKISNDMFRKGLLQGLERALGEDWQEQIGEQADEVLDRFDGMVKDTVVQLHFIPNHGVRMITYTGEDKRAEALKPAADGMLGMPMIVEHKDADDPFDHTLKRGMWGAWLLEADGWMAGNFNKVRRQLLGAD